MTLEEAKIAGAKRYYTGIPCAFGHVVDRFVASRSCVECRKISVREWRDRNRPAPRLLRDPAEKYAGRIAYNRKWRQANPSKARAHALRYYQSHKAERLAEVRKRQAAQRMPTWANPEAIKLIYRQCRETTKRTGIKHHVDHVVPLQGELVCGLHVENNLQIIPALDNIRKGNAHG